MKNICVFDLDGTLADLSHRLPLLKQKNPQWDKFYELVGDDSVNKWCKDLMAAMQIAGKIVIIVSARPQTVLGITKKWLKNNEVPYNQIFLLREGNKDYRPDVELKRAWLNFYKREHILFAVDDRQRVVDMWRSEGITCLQCNAWEEYKRNGK